MKTIFLIILSLLPLPAFGQAMDREEFIRQNALCWEQMKIEFPQWATGEGKRAALVWMKEYDKWAKKENPSMLDDPWRPLWYARARAEDIRLAQARNAAVAESWAKQRDAILYPDRKSPAQEDLETERQNQQLIEQGKIDRERRETERRLRELERKSGR